ncbi:cysteine-rich CWC family protein [Malaciobacter mytili]|uniref:Cysteine-rich CWC domain-containing protein n=1 Tax=Malaciobacter mytili LMG 24559 TaxID=1032238 RepID=A0AAX2AFC9_9BACT|nr:cysteine-rich CWC domain-containing protein [Malaciobacter mytili LMG 24559]RXI43626.1 hypothetical protein CRU99_06760 [Malaciobacter mytili]RXK15727.1 hypothetical protein CP985_07415 [Malaciobacter mytili LMG 24559]
MFCPFCKKHNNCNSLNINSCWCKNKNIPKELISLSSFFKEKSCICESCVDLFLKDKELFKKKFIPSL